MTNQELKKLIEAANRDIDYCKNEIASLAQNAEEYPINKGYAEKEIAKTKEIIKSHQRRLDSYTAQLKEDTKAEEKPVFSGKKYYTCRRCSGTGVHCGGVCYGCSGGGKKKTKAYRDFLGEPDVNSAAYVFS